jgi:oligopeptide/dipeptide ABC transporter ATP-binding protein
MSPLVQVSDLHVRYRAPARMADLIPGRARRANRAVNGVNLHVARGESLGLVGESGCGKSTLGRAILRLTPASSGTVCFDGENVLEMRGADLLRFRRRAQMVFQDPYASLNPRLTVAETLGEVLRVHGFCAATEIGSRVRSLMSQVGLPAELASRRPRSLSGGQCQRVGIARALAVGAELIVADEPASALDVSIQAQILNLLTRLQREMGLTLLFISHDLGVVHHLCQRVAVMYLGRIVEQGPTDEVFRNPRHPYTQALLAAIPRMEPTATLPAAALPGEPPSPLDAPAGCPFHPRCPHVMPVCRSGEPPSFRAAGEALVACHLYPAEDLQNLTAMSTGSESAL